MKDWKKHSTFNIQRPASNETALFPRWELNVEGWMLNVCWFFHRKEIP
jgi:hypothetical protein